MRWGHVDESGVRAAFLPHSDIQPLAIHWDGRQPRTCTQQRTPRTRIARILDPSPVPLIEQHTGCEVQCLLRASHDNDLLSYAAHGAGLAKIAGDYLAKWFVTGSIAITEERTL